jgi:DNA-binding transcriptional ArsR family regulator
MALVDPGSDLDEGLRALAHPARREILSICTDRWVAAGDIANALDLAPATTSEHLKVLRKSGLVDMRTEGTFRLYRTDTDNVRLLVDMLSALYPTFTGASPPSKEQQ